MKGKGSGAEQRGWKEKLGKGMRFVEGTGEEEGGKGTEGRGKREGSWKGEGNGSFSHIPAPLVSHFEP